MAKPPPKGPRKDTDRLDQGPLPPRAPRVQASTSLPVNDPGSEEQQRAAIQRTIDELEQSFRFMGAAHPDYAKVKARLEQLRGMLERK